MLYSHKELKKILKSDYQIKKALSNKQYYKIEDGIYSDIEFVNPLEVIAKKYPTAIFTLDSAFYYHNLTDVIPNHFFLATPRSYTRMKNDNIKQVFIPEELFHFGTTKIEIENTIINIYDKERMLIELIRKKNIIPFDYYKEIINNYRKHLDEIDTYKLLEYISYYKNEQSLYETLQREVF